MSAAPRPRLIPFVVSTALVLAGALAGCSGEDNDKADGKKSPSAAPTVVDGFTVPGLELKFGDKAVVKWNPGSFTGEFEAVVDKVKVAQVKEFAGYQLTKEMLASTPYFVTISVRNTGESDLGGQVLPIYLDNGGSTLYPSVEIPHFKKCSPRELPKKFAAGARTDLCMIFLAPKGSELRSVALWPDGDKEQIDWTGEVIDPVAEKKKRAAEKKAKKEQQKKDKKASGSASPSASNTD